MVGDVPSQKDYLPCPMAQDTSLFNGEGPIDLHYIQGGERQQMGREAPKER